MRTGTLLVTTAVFLAFASHALAGDVDFQYVRAESAFFGCGEDIGTPVWTSTTYGYSTNDNQTDTHTAWLPGSFPYTNIDAVRFVVRCDGCQFYGHSINNWYWYDPVVSSWDPTIDLGGYYTMAGGDYYYRGEEKDEMCNEIYGNGEFLIGFSWNTQYPGDYHGYRVRYPWLIE